MTEMIQSNKLLSAYEEVFHVIRESDEIRGISSTAVRELFAESDPEESKMTNILNKGVYERMKEYRKNSDITFFRGEYDFLSNFFEAGIEYKGICYRNNEAAFQAQKCLSEEAKWEFSYLSAAKAKRKGRQVDLRPDWEEVKIGIMEEIVREKFSQNPYLAEKLISTKDRKLVEGNTWKDTFWGVDAEKRKGENHLGVILMKVRKDLTRNKQE